MTTDPAALLAARLDIAEAAALAASPDGRTEWRKDIQRNDENEVAGYGVTAWPGDEPVAEALSPGAFGEAVITHIAARDPKSTLAQVAADRLILALYEEARRRGGGWAEARFQALDRVIGIRAAAWPEPQEDSSAAIR